MKKYRVDVQGMTCTGCEEHIAVALEAIGAKAIQADFRKGEALFELPENMEVEKAKKAIAEAKYQPGEAEEVRAQEALRPDEEGEFDYIIIGSGGAAFSSAIEAVKHGAKVAMIERGTVGGTCVNIGCVPSKTLLRAGEINHLARNNPFIGLHTSANEVDLAPLVKQKEELVTDLRNKKYVDLIEDYGFELIKGEARFVDEHTIEVDGLKLSAKRFLIATGAAPAVPAISGLAEVDYLTSTTLLELKKVPKRLTVIGSGYIGVELGQLFHHLGSEVTLIQRSSRLFKEYDPEISEALTKALTEQGIQLVTGATYERIEQDGEVKKVYVEVDGQKRIIESEQLLIAAGRKPNTESLNLQAAGVETGRLGEIRIDDYAKTTNERIYAAGDVTLGPQFVYVAAYQGRVAAGNAVGGRSEKLDLAVVPGVTFTAPAVATVGLTEKQAKENGYDVLTSVLPLEAVPRAQVNRETTGVFKLVADATTRQLLGGHIVAENAGDVIYAVTLAVKFGLTIENLSETFAPYLTMAEGVKLAALTFDQDVSHLSCCAG
ncbi:mercury(II) reductase [Planococcus plakortidis]|uniref:Mercuric reductase n=1 Tax=Planococcus plakortidis TaxID=1038856 RepID=A0A1C7EB64_9BACL|nr:MULTISPECIES: mercury(II) reductase [Planococcus]ANU20662.1 mercury(II) reductase [Planococcus plakortidis]AUD12452.1 mercury(II) reductase [Planococcus sp. MB-3u-03]PKG47165.1 mercury(II) reductase [Planococcus sp. Urea-trap-24]PKG87639.1 mercury(II) reductase [Planococcus sp. Urea-3u-39]PKG87706.1 mercury(II) reductase [Planococcus sp. Urea-3u-39]